MANPLHSSLSSEWYTPPETMELVKSVLGEIDLDPASNPLANEIVGAKHIFTKDNGTLSLESWNWTRYGRTFFCNPPYSDDGGVEPWIRACKESGLEGILLLNATTDSKWFKLLWERFDLCFLYNRIRFLETPEQRNNRLIANGKDVPASPPRRTYVDGKLIPGPSPTHGSVFALVGLTQYRRDVFKSVMDSHGHIVRRALM